MSETNNNTGTTGPKGDYNQSLTPLFKAKRSGNLTVAIDPARFDAFQQHLRVGGMLIVRYLMPHQIKGEKSPVAYLDFVTPEKLEQLKAERESGKAAEVI